MWKPFIEDSEHSTGLSAGCRNKPVVGTVANGKNGSCKVFLFQGDTESCPFARHTTISIDLHINPDPVWRSVTQSRTHLPKGGDTQRAVLAFSSQVCALGQRILVPA